MKSSGDPRPLGVLGLQGDFDAHRVALEEIGEPALVVLRPGDLERVRGLILPGGESTTLIKLMEGCGLFEPLRRFHAAGAPLFGTCAGAILMARQVSHPEQFSLGFLDIDIERNAYGRQAESFETAEGVVERGCDLVPDGLLELVLIRAPRIRRCGRSVSILARHGDDPVLVRQGSVLAGTFHPELGRDRRVHRYFAAMAHEASLTA